METELRQIIDDLNYIKNELNTIKQSMPDKDMFLNSEEKKLLKESLLNEKKGKLVSSSNIKKSLGI